MTDREPTGSALRASQAMSVMDDALWRAGRTLAYPHRYFDHALPAPSSVPEESDEADL